jgi:hypothetical protein
MGVRSTGLAICGALFIAAAAPACGHPQTNRYDALANAPFNGDSTGCSRAAVTPPSRSWLAG